MIHIVMKNRKVLRYNTAHNVTVNTGIVTVLNEREEWIAKIPTDNIERIEATKPCAIFKDRPAPKRAKY